MLILLAAGLSSFTLAYFLFPPLIRRALAWRFVDRPGGRKLHSGAVPPIGGLVIIPVTLLFCSLFGFSPVAHWPLYASLFIVLAVGVVDDLRGISAQLKFFIHFIVAGILVFSGEARLDSLGPLFGDPFDLGVFAIPFSMACVVYLINALNMIDGLDGLAGGLSSIMAAWFLVAAVSAGFIDISLPLSALIGALGGFLAYNMRSPWRAKAAVFLGDAGSMSLGVFLAWAAMNVARGPDIILDPIAVAFVLSLPIIDAFALLFFRVLSGKPAFAADRNHFHHRFIDSGFTPHQATLSMMTLSVFLGAVGVFGIWLGVSHMVLTIVWIFLWLGHAALIRQPAFVLSVLARIHAKVFGLDLVTK